MSNSSIWPIDRTLLGATTPRQSGSKSDDNEGVLRILQSSSITEASSSDCFVSYSGYSLQSVYFTAPADWCVCVCVCERERERERDLSAYKMHS